MSFWPHSDFTSSFVRLIDGNVSRWFWLIKIPMWWSHRDLARPHHTYTGGGIYSCCSLWVKSMPLWRKLALSLHIIAVIPAVMIDRQEGQGQIEKRETKGGTETEKAIRWQDREAQGQMDCEIDKHINQETLGVVPGWGKAHGLEVKGCGLSR